jgi:hypothetical protein
MVLLKTLHFTLAIYTVMFVMIFNDLPLLFGQIIAWRIAFSCTSSLVTRKHAFGVCFSIFSTICCQCLTMFGAVPAFIFRLFLRSRRTPQALKEIRSFAGFYFVSTSLFFMSRAISLFINAALLLMIFCPHFIINASFFGISRHGGLLLRQRVSVSGSQMKKAFKTCGADQAHPTGYIVPQFVCGGNV